MARDRNLNPHTQPQTRKVQIYQSQIDAIHENAKHARELLGNPFFTQYLEQAQKDILNIHAKQLAIDISETEKKTQTISETKIYPAKKEYIMLAGEYRFMERLQADLQQLLENERVLNEKLQAEELEIVEENE